MSLRLYRAIAAHPQRQNELFSFCYVHTATPRSCCLVHCTLLTFPSAMSTRLRKFEQRLLYNSQRCSNFKIHVDDCVKGEFANIPRPIGRVDRIHVFFSDVFTFFQQLITILLVDLFIRMRVFHKVFRFQLCLNLLCNLFYKTKTYLYHSFTSCKV